MKRCLVLLGLLGCSSAEDRWTSATRSINGELRALRPTAHAIASGATREDPTSVRAMILVCSSMDSALNRIITTRESFRVLATEPGGPHSYPTDVHDRARHLVVDRFDMCEGDDWRCRNWCVRSWKALVDAVEVLRGHAAKHGAHLESLSYPP